ncbi:unnamed protein product, partial [Coregonus sp. 'balchen']
DITQKGYEKKRAKLLAPFLPQITSKYCTLSSSSSLRSPPSVELALPDIQQQSSSGPTSGEPSPDCSPASPEASSPSSSSGGRRNRSGGARDDRYRSDIHTEAVQAALAKHKEEKMALPMPTKRRSAFVQSPVALSAVLAQSLQSPDYWINRSNSVPPDVTSSTPERGTRVDSRVDLPPNAMPRAMPRGQSRTSMLDTTADGVPVNSRVSTKIQQLLNTLKRPKRPPLSEFFLDDSEEIVEVPQPDPNTPRPEGRQIIPVKGEPLGVVSNWPPALQAALARWGATQAKSPALTALDVTGKPLYTLTYGKLWSRSLKLAYTLLNKLGTKNEPVLRPGDTDAGSLQIGFLLGSCGVDLALTSEICLKGLPKTPQGEIMQFKGWPRMKWVYKASKEGTVMGVAVSKIALLTHCQALTQACNYCEGHVMNRIHTITVPYAVMKACPMSWVQRVHIHKARVAVVKCRDLHWAMMAHRDQRDTNLSSIRMLIVADGANPWSVSSCDAFLNVFQSHGLKPEVICPCASSPEGLTVAIRRPGARGTALPARAILSMGGLSHGVIRVNTEDKNSALTPDGPPQLCKTDEIGEIVLNSRAGGTMYYGLPGVTKNTFEVIPVNQAGAPIGELPFTRTGLLGFVGPGSLVFVVGKNEGLLMVSGRRHNADDLVATALAVEPVKTVYRGRIAVFSVTVFYDERIVIVAEQRPDASEEDSFQWMSRVLQAIDSIHQVGLYCLALVPANTLPKTPLGGIHISETKQNFLEGNLHPCNILLCPHTCVTNLPKPRQKQPVGVGPASIMVGNLVAGNRMAQAAGRELGVVEEEGLVRKHQFLSEALQWRAQSDPDHVLYVLLNAKLHKRAEKITSALMERGGLNTGDNVVLLYPPGIDLIAAFYGCLYAGLIPVTVRPPHPQNLAATLPTVRMIIDVSKAAYDLPRRRPPQLYKPPTAEMLAYLDFSVSTTGMLTGVKRKFYILCVCSVYSGHQSILIPPMELEMSLPLWLSTLSQYKIRDTFCSYSVMELCTKGLGTQTDALKARGVNLSCVRSCVVIAEERPRLGTAGPDPSTVYVDMKSLRHDRVRLILPGVRVIIVNPETRGPLGDSHLGEIWVQSPHSSSGYYTIYGEESLQADHFNTRLSFGEPHTLWARTGYLGFVKRTELLGATGDRHDALFVVGQLDETLELRGLRYHPIDIETSCCVHVDQLLVGGKLPSAPRIFLSLAACSTGHHLMFVVVIVPGVIPHSRGETEDALDCSWRHWTHNVKLDVVTGPGPIHTGCAGWDPRGTGGVGGMDPGAVVAKGSWMGMQTDWGVVAWDPGVMLNPGMRAGMHSGVGSMAIQLGIYGPIHVV